MIWATCEEITAPPLIAGGFRSRSGNIEVVLSYHINSLKGFSSMVMGSGKTDGKERRVIKADGSRQKKAPVGPESRDRNVGFLPHSREWDCSDPNKRLPGALIQNCDFDTATYTYCEGINHRPEVVAHYKTHRRDTHERTLGGPTAWQLIPAGLSGKRSIA